VNARELARDVLVRVDDGAFANRLLPAALADSGLDERDRHHTTELVYGTVRMQRACDSLLAPRTKGWDRLEAPVRASLRLGAYQLVFLSTPPHAAVGETVSATPLRARGLVNAVLRRLAADLAAGPLAWPDDATRLSYPDWIVRRLETDIGHADAVGALSAMNEPATSTMRADGYTQDLASQWVADLVEAGEGMRVLDVCAAPGGKATALAATGAQVVAADRNPGRADLITDNARMLGARLPVVIADGRWPPHAASTFDRVLVDAPCSGLGVLRRRADARWRITQADVDALVLVQRALLAAAIPLLRPGGVLTYSVCTLTEAETTGIDDWLAITYSQLTPLDVPPAPWRPHGRGALLLPQAAGTDGMYVLRVRVPTDLRSA
jgi:16S rRNA (cytosine967-C5)-methyltransferase